LLSAVLFLPALLLKVLWGVVSTVVLYTTWLALVVVCMIGLWVGVLLCLAGELFIGLPLVGGIVLVEWGLL
jgi:hypothetical protein